MIALVVALVSSLAMITSPALATTRTPPSLTVTCTSTVSYGDPLTCWAASTDANGDFAEAGTFTFDAARALPATWSPKTCYVNNSECQVEATVSTPANAQPRTVGFVVSFKGADGVTVTTTISVDLTLRPTVATLVCDNVNLAIGGSTHCSLGVADQLYDWDSKPAKLPAGSAGLTVTSSEPGDTIVYDKPSPDHASCVPAVANGLLACGLTLTADQVPGLRALTASYPGDPAADEQPTTTVLKVANGPRVTPTITLVCPDSVPALAPVASCQVTVAGPAAGVLVPSGSVAFDQDSGQPVDWSDAQTCQLAAGTCTVSIGVFQTGYDAPTPVRVTYAGDDGYLPGTADDQVAVLPTPTTSAMTCDTASPAPGSLLHCTLTITGPQGTPVPVSPLDEIDISTSEGSVICDVPAPAGCGYVDTDTATVVGFGVQLDQSTGPQLVVGAYSGDTFDLVAGSTGGFSWVIPTPAVLQPQPDPVITPPPAVPPVATATSTAVACVGPVAFRHATQCTVAVTAAGAPVTTGSVQVSASTGSPGFPAASCLLSDEGLCTVTVASQAVPGAAVSLLAAYSGAHGIAASSGTGTFTVHAVPTSVALRCAGTTIRPKAIVSCVATVVTRYGTPAAPPPVRPSQVTVSARGDAIVYGSRTSKSCHWTTTSAGLTCHFSVRVSSAAGLRLVRLHYSGTIGTTHNAASVGQATFTVKAKR